MEGPEEAEVVLVNTCAFITPAVEESIDTILELAKGCSEGRRLVVCGCLVSRYGKEVLSSLLPEVSLFVDFAEYPALPGMLDAEDDTSRMAYREAPRVRHHSSTLTKGYVYIKISEGCRGGCSYCTIPMIRGPLRSRPLEEIAREAIHLLALGAKELVLVAQDTTAYGMDLYGRRSLSRLLELLSDLEGDYMLRVMYMHPEGVDEELLASMDSGRVFPYFDLPFQHADDAILARMGRKSGGKELVRLVEKIRGRFPEAALRGTCIVGFPGEGEKEFQRLLEFVQDVCFDHLAVFPFFPEEGTLAAGLPDAPEREIALERKRLLEEVQDGIAAEKAALMLGRRLRVLVEGECEDDPRYLEARSYREAPEVDGLILISRPEKIRLCGWQMVKIVGMEGLDLVAELEETQRTSSG